MGNSKIPSSTLTKMGIKGFKNTKDTPSVPLEALSASSKPKTRINSSLQSESYCSSLD